MYDETCPSVFAHLDTAHASMIGMWRGANLSRFNGTGMFDAAASTK